MAQHRANDAVPTPFETQLRRWLTMVRDMTTMQIVGVIVLEVLRYLSVLEVTL